MEQVKRGNRKYQLIQMTLIFGFVLDLLVLFFQLFTKQPFQLVLGFSFYSSIIGLGSAGLTVEHFAKKDVKK